MKRVLLWGVVMPAVLRRIVPAWLIESPLLVVVRHPWVSLATVGVVVAAGALLVSATGVIPITASGGHWRLTEGFLQFSKAQSISTHSRGIDVPALDDPALVLRGAGHFDLGCRPCHGSTAGTVPRLAESMLPSPPDLALRAPLRTPAELFYVVKHGIKMTGMPAWPALQRDDEIWAIVAFLRRLPALAPDEYRTLTRGESDHPFDLFAEATTAPEVVRETCARCHGLDGNGRSGDAFPRLAGQRVDYLDRALQAYARRGRHSGVMGPIAAALTRDVRADAAAYYAAQKPAGARAVAAGADLARGERLARTGDPDRMVPACLECHGTGGPRNPAYPVLSGQPAAYLSLQLMLLRQRARGGSEYVHLMHSFVDRLTDDQIRDVTSYFAASADRAVD